MSSVEFINTNKVYANGKHALKDLNLSIKDGEFLVLVGSSGCGKSTALRLLAGLESPTSGDILIAGNSVKQLSPQQRNIAMVFQNYSLYPHMNVRQNLEFPLKMQKYAKDQIKKRVNEAVELLQLKELLNQKPRQLSGGQSQRVAIGRAIVRHPNVFLMDEPLSNLDANLRMQIRSEIAALQKKLNVTALYVTHDQAEAMTLGDRVAVLSNGELQQLDKPQHLYEKPVNRFVAQFLGNPGMNISKCTVKNVHDVFEVEIAGERLALPRVMSPGILDGEQGKSLFIGMRPEALSLRKKELVVNTTIVSIEAFGHEKLVHVQVGNQQDNYWVARLSSSASVHTGQKLPLYTDINNLYFFDENGVVIDRNVKNFVSRGI